MEKIKYWLKKYSPKIFLLVFGKVYNFFIFYKKSFKYIKFENEIKSQSRHAEISYFASIDDDTEYLNYDLLKKSISWIEIAIKTNLNTNHIKPDSKFYNIFPGEHYRLLSAMCISEKPKNIVDIGTFTGMSSRVFLDHSTANIHTLDIIKWSKLDSHLSNDDFESGRIVQILDDLTYKNNFEKNKNIFKNSDLIFLDGPKNIVFENNLKEYLQNLEFISKKRYLVVDDIRFPNMFNFWRSISSPKIDLTSFGHFTGTGVVDISNGLDIKT